jgi:DNA polymerase-3 subunit gamma/tau
VALIGEKREVGLQMDVQRYVKPVAFKPGAITYESAPGAPVDLARKLASRLRDWTGRTWLIAANGQGGGETMIEIDRRKRGEERAEIEADPFITAVMQAFPGAKIGEVKTLAAPVELPAIPDEAGEED